MAHLVLPGGDETVAFDANQVHHLTCHATDMTAGANTTTPAVC